MGPAVPGRARTDPSAMTGSSAAALTVLLLATLLLATQLPKKSMSSFRRFWVRSAFMHESNFGDVLNVLRVLKKGYEAFLQDPPKIIPIPNLSTRLHQPHHPLHSEEDKDANTGLVKGCCLNF
ncbi:hypothetical protein E2C01_063029 [Portunus trituberculatus]|uniref:Uncharacterized protein n=1 Tax=Portunus trituberculatus TaxID=210409 RepID=A0A5B7HGE9_PORTR|nr:hypothetical protein [Portunus trituberculatus]